MKYTTKTHPISTAIKIALFPMIFSTPIVIQAEEADDDQNINKIIVTATKRAKPSQETALSLSVITEDLLQESGIDSVEELSVSIPGMSVVNAGTTSTIELRGIADLSRSVQTGATTGTYVDEISTSTSGGGAINMALFDAERVEILRGPQGTLFGDGSLSGTIRVITNKPDSLEFSGRVVAQAINTTDGDGSTVFRGMVNMPLIEDELALRITAEYNDNGGWYDNVITGDEDTNSQEVTNIRSALRWTPNDEFIADLVIGRTNTEADDTFYGTSERIKEQTMLEPVSVEGDSISLTLNYELDSVQLTSATGHFTQESENKSDQSVFTNVVLLPGLNYVYGGYGIPPVPSQDSGWLDTGTEFDVLNQEFRISSIGDNAIDWTIGAYYHKDSRDYLLLGQTTYTGAPTGSAGPFTAASPLLGTSISADNKSYALFGEVEIELSDNLELTVGGRYFNVDNDVESITYGYSVDPGGWVFTETNSSSESVFSPKLALVYKYSDDLTFYAQGAKGFRSGGANPYSTLIPIFNFGLTVDATFGSDEVTNFEVGVKSSLLDNNLMLNTYIYQMEWTDQQVFRMDNLGLLGYYINADEAKSTGIEVEAVANVIDNLQFTLALNYMDTEYVGDTVNPLYAPFFAGSPALAIEDGNLAPRSPEFKGSLGVTYYKQVTENFEGIFNLSYTYTGDFYSDSQNIEPFKNDNSGLLNMRLAVQGESLGVALFAHNLTDEAKTISRAANITSAVLGSNLPNSNYLRPRSIGIEVSYSF